MFRSKPILCKSCKNEIKSYEKAWIHMPIPSSGMTNIKKYIELDGEIYCNACAGVCTKQNNEMK
ncbi:hypothetical protein ACO11K_001796 [Bacillus cytotoxicus]|uniref:hypothetical protein n=1 Tax=Bacillus cereus group sp. BfR-BA-01492 TaxID=2920361 RepID=UPI001F5992D9|nr:hypothetical protein [Bacillus cereus group sp. BfR-BA-01492]